MFAPHLYVIELCSLNEFLIPEKIGHPDGAV